MSIIAGKKVVLAAVLVLIAVVPTVWLAALEFRTNDHLVDEVDRGLRTDAELFVERLAHHVETRVYEENARGAVESTGYLIPDPNAATGYSFNIAFEYTIPGIVEYPFFIDFAEQTVYLGKDAVHQDEILQVFSLDSLYERVPDYYGYILRGYVEGPYGPFHYVYTFDMVGAASDIIMRGVKINPAVVETVVLPDAFRTLKANISHQRGFFPDEMFGIEVTTPSGTHSLSKLPGLSRRASNNATGSIEASFDPGGLFSNWTAQIQYVNHLKAQQLTRYIAILVPLLIVVFGVVVAIRLTLREVELSKAKSAFVSNVSHELKTPLSKIRFFNEMLKNGHSLDGEKRSKYFEIVEQECERLTVLIENVLDFSQIERGEMSYSFQQNDLRQIVAEVCSTFSLLYKSRGYDLDVRLPEGTHVTMLDGNAIRQALINLLDNAVKYSEPHTVVVALDFEHRGHEHVARLSVTDKGIGIPEGKKKLIFKEFYRIENGLSQRVAGSGLGLALVYHITQAHGGEVEVESMTGGGSTFSLLLPISSEVRLEPEQHIVRQPATA